MRKIVIAMMVGLMALTSMALPVFADEQTDAASSDAEESSSQDATATAADETAEQSTSETRQGKEKRAPKQEVAEPENAIGKDAAKEKALTDAGLTSAQTGKVRSRVTILEDGTVIYKVKFTYDNQKYSYKIDATTGEILDKSTKAVTEAATDGTAKTKHGHKGPRRSEVAEPENAIGKDAAKAKALADAGLTSDQTGKVRSRVTTLEDGTVIYKVKFTYDNQKYTYQINATTGAVIDKTVE